MIAPMVALVTARARARWLLARAPLPAIVAKIDARRSHADATASSVARVCTVIARTERIVDRVPGIGRQCLHRALGRYAALRRAGIDATLKIGVRSAADLVGHAWIEVDGAPVLEREPPRFIVTYSTRAQS